MKSFSCESFVFGQPPEPTGGEYKTISQLNQRIRGSSKLVLTHEEFGVNFLDISVLNSCSHVRYESKDILFSLADLPVTGIADSK